MELYISNNHYFVITFNGYCLMIDTGCKESFSFLEDINISLYNGLDEYTEDTLDFTLKKDPTKLINMKYVKELTGFDCDGFIGLDIIKQTGLTIDFVSHNVSFTTFIDKSEEDEFKSMDFNINNGYIEINNCIKVNNQDLYKVIVDSGAYISYINTKYLYKSDETNTIYIDYNQMLGVLEGKYYGPKINVKGNNIIGKEKTEFVGLLNDKLNYFDAIINPKVISDQIIIFDFNKKLIKFK